jgi:hypothetical protein
MSLIALAPMSFFLYNPCLLLLPPKIMVVRLLLYLLTLASWWPLPTFAALLHLIVVSQHRVTHLLRTKLIVPTGTLVARPCLSVPCSDWRSCPCLFSHQVLLVVLFFPLLSSYSSQQPLVDRETQLHILP